VFGTALGSGFGTAGIYARHVPSSGSNFNNTAPTRFNGSLEWTSPTIESFTARVLYAPQVDVAGAGGLGGCIASSATACGTATATQAALIPGANRAGVTDVSLAYNKGQLNAVVAQQSVKIGTNGVNTLVSPVHNTNAAAAETYKLTTVGVNYGITATLRAYAAYFTEKQGTTHDAKSYMLGAKYTMGAIDLSASMIDNDSKLANNRDRKITGLGVDYNLSKRSALYARFESRDANTNDATDNATHGVTKTTHVGIRHTF
jgi:predicted porin